MSVRFLAVILLVVLGLVRATPAAAQQPSCRFVLGFAALRDLVGPSKVGNCLEDEHFNLENGNAEQRTSGGLLVWRKIDNFTAFTDGGTTWVNGPNGLQSRPNAERFSWERDPVEPGAGPSAGATPGPTPTLTPVPGAPTSRPTAPSTTPARSAPADSGPCSPAYPDFCIPPPPPDVNCNSQVIGGRTGFTARPPDPHRLDQDGNGIACEGSNR